MLRGLFSVVVQGRYYSGGEGRGDYVVMIKTKKGKPNPIPIHCMRQQYEEFGAHMS
jgi:hypothetical protein